MKKIIVMMIAASLVVSLTAGCGDNGKKNGTGSDSTQSQKSDAAVDEDLASLIDNAGSIGEGTAGSSLKRAIIAHDLAALAAEKGYTKEDIETLKSTFASTINTMNEDTRNSVNSIFSNSVFPMLDSMINDNGYDKVKGLFEDAGVGSDMGAILKTPGLEDSYSSVKSAYQEYINSVK